MKKSTFKISFAIPNHSPISIINDNPELILDEAFRFLSKKLENVERKYTRFYKSSIINPITKKEDSLDLPASPAIFINNKKVSYITRVKR